MGWGGECGDERMGGMRGGGVCEEGGGAGDGGCYEGGGGGSEEIRWGGWSREYGHAIEGVEP